MMDFTLHLNSYLIVLEICSLTGKDKLLVYHHYTAQLENIEEFTTLFPNASKDIQISLMLKRPIALR